MDYPWPVYGNELYHHGVKGQKWGIRRYQNEDGSLTLRGKMRYGRQTSDAKNILTTQIRADQKEVKRTASKARKLEAKLDKADAAGNENKSQKLMKKLTPMYTQGIATMQRLNANQKTLKEINDGTLLAGRDFYAKVSTKIIVLPGATVVRKQRDFKLYSAEDKAQLQKEGKLRK